jgi:hypothetical protein
LCLTAAVEHDWGCCVTEAHALRRRVSACLARRTDETQIRWEAHRI